MLASNIYSLIHRYDMTINTTQPRTLSRTHARTHLLACSRAERASCSCPSPSSQAAWARLNFFCSSANSSSWRSCSAAVELAWAAAAAAAAAAAPMPSESWDPNSPPLLLATERMGACRQQYATRENAIAFRTSSSNSRTALGFYPLTS